MKKQQTNDDKYIFKRFGFQHNPFPDSSSELISGFTKKIKNKTENKNYCFCQIAVIPSFDLVQRIGLVIFK